MERVINDLAETPPFVSELEGALIITNGFNKPRFADASSGISGVVGFNEWTDKPTLNATSTGSLDSGKYYSIRMVPLSNYTLVNSQFLRGRPCVMADGQTGSTGYLFDLIEHPDTVTFNTGEDTAGTASAATDSTKAWSVDQWVGYECLNVSTGVTAGITANTATVLTLDADLSLGVGDSFSIIGPRATSYFIYAAEANTLDDLVAATWYFQDVVTAGTATYDLTSLALGDVMIEEEYFQPPNFTWNTNAYSRIFGGGGIVEARGKASATGTTVTGNTSGDDQTYFTDGLVGAYIQFTGDATSYLVSDVDVINQTLAISETYAGFASSDTAFQIVSEYDVWWSDVRNPHVYRTGNSIAVPDRSVNAVELGGYLIVFCENSIWKMALANLGELPTKVSDTVQCRAPFSLVRTPAGIFFWDGEGFSLTDGQSVVRVTQYKAQDYLNGINRSMIYNIRGVYNAAEKRVEFYFAYGNDITNNYGLYITVDSLNCYAFTRLDCNAVWTDLDDTETSRVYHGTSGRHTDSGEGDVWEHTPNLPTDGDYGLDAYYMTVTAVNTTTRTISVQSDGGTTPAEEGWSFLYLPSVAGGTPRQMMVKTITSTGTGPQTYDIVIGDDFQVDDIAAGDILFMGGILLTYGPVWTDFGSPIYQHHVRALQVDTNGFEGVMIVSHYKDAKDGLTVEANSYSINIDNQHVVVPVKMGSSKTYGFKIQCVGITQPKIYSINRLFDVEV